MSNSLPTDTLGSSLRDSLRLCLIPGIGPRIRQRLLQHFGDVLSIFAASAEQLRNVPGVGPQLSERILRAGEIDVDREISLCQQQGIDILLESDSRYPVALREIPDPPGVLFRRGTHVANDQLAVAIVGTRHATRYGLRQAERLAGGLARAGLTIVSGLARGIDAAAHRAALAAGGRTLAVLGSGVLNVYPPEHADLAIEIARQGAVYSELPPLQQPMSGTFPQRNRLISGLSLGVLVVEAADRSGALISASHAAEQGREVFAVPGPADCRTSRGCHQLIRDGAKLVEVVEDVLDELGPLFAPFRRDDGQSLRHPAELQLNPQERRVLDAIATEATDLDQIVRATQVPVHRVLATISVLEIRHLVRRVGGNAVIRL